MPPDLESSISFLEETNDPANAYFSFSVDNTGEYGIIRANKEGLRLYAAEMLKKSLLLEETQDGEPLFFGHLEWVVSDAGYDLIAGVLPQYRKRGEILAARATETADARNTDNVYARTSGSPDFPDSDQPGKKVPIPRGGCLFSLLLLAIGGLILFAAVKAFATLHL